MRRRRPQWDETDRLPSLGRAVVRREPGCDAGHGLWLIIGLPVLVLLALVFAFATLYAALTPR